MLEGVKDLSGLDVYATAAWNIFIGSRVFSPNHLGVMFVQRSVVLFICAAAAVSATAVEDSHQIPTADRCVSENCRSLGVCVSAECVCGGATCQGRTASDKQ